MAALSPGVLVIATHNTGKVREIAELLEGTPWGCEPLPSAAPEFREDGETFQDNARGKALHYAAWTGHLALADDSGLEIDALGGEPGVRSARYIDPAIGQRERNRLVLERLVDVPEAERTARFVCHLALARDGAVERECVGICEGHVVRHARGAEGFGYDPIFRPLGEKRTFAEMSQRQKARMSHRARAVREIVRQLVS